MNNDANGSPRREDSVLKSATPSGVSPRKRMLRLRRVDPTLVAELRRMERMQESGAEAGNAAVHDEMDRLQQENQQLRELHLRSRAELENFRKRTQRDREQTQKFAIEDLVREIVPIVDNFDRALASKDQTTNLDVFAKGVDMILNQLHGMLEARGVKKIDPLGQPFDPQYHEAVTTVPSRQTGDEGTVVEVLQPGYELSGRVIRPAIVAIAKAG